jgi:primase-polymerase (primpol)-like protein
MSSVTQDPNRPPPTLEVDPAGIPSTMQQAQRWLVWRWQYYHKWTKPPFQPSGYHAKSDDPATWTSFDIALPPIRRANGPGSALR